MPRPGQFVEIVQLQVRAGWLGVSLPEGTGEGDLWGLYLLLGAELSRLALFSSQSSRWPSGISAVAVVSLDSR